METISATLIIALIPSSLLFVGILYRLRHLSILIRISTATGVVGLILLYAIASPGLFFIAMFPITLGALFMLFPVIMQFWRAIKGYPKPDPSQLSIDSSQIARTLLEMEQEALQPVFTPQIILLTIVAFILTLVISAAIS